MTAPTREQVLEWAESAGFTIGFRTNGAIAINGYIENAQRLCALAAKAKEEEMLDGIVQMGASARRPA